MSGGELKINVGDLDAGGRQYAFTLRAAWIRGVLEDHEATARGDDGLLDVRASRSGNDVVVHGTLKAPLEVPCARCLTPVPLDVDVPLSLLFTPGKLTPPPKAAAKSESDKGDKKRAAKKESRRKAELEEYELSAEDADTLPYDGEVVILDDVVRDELILETPIFPLCSEDCPGMSPAPGVSSESVGALQGGSGASSASTNGDGSEASSEGAAIDPRLLPLLKVRAKRD